MHDILTFRKMVSPFAVQILFWIGAAVCVVVGVVAVVQAAQADSASGVLVGLLWLVVGPAVVRIECELVIIFFRIYDVLVEIRQHKVL